MPVIYHITNETLWNHALEVGAYEAPSLKLEGFIHCSNADQLEGVLERYYQGATHLLKLTIDTDKLTSQLIYDWSPSTADTFPHIYGPININAVVLVEKIIS